MLAMAEVLLGDPNFEQRNLPLLRFIEDLKLTIKRRDDLDFSLEKIPLDRIQMLKSLPLDLRIFYSQLGEIQISHKSGYAIFDLFLPKTWEQTAFLYDWKFEEIKERGLIDKMIIGVAHINQNIQNLLFYDRDTFEIDLLITNNGKGLIDILRIELDGILSV